MTTNAAFAELLNDKELCLSIGISETNWKQLRKRLRDNSKELSIQVKIHWLQQAGYEYNMTWKRPKFRNH